jgi:hypothetical protein
VSLALLTAVGCTGNADRALEEALNASGQTRTIVYPFAGKVTIDGEPPKLERRQRLVVMLNDSAHSEVPTAQRTYVIAGPEGEFAFGTYKSDDGVAPGKYVVTFAVFKRRGNAGLEGPDALQNLYNDPEKNAGFSELVIDHKAPGSFAYEFWLTIAGKDAGTLGPHSLTNLRDTYLPTKKERN